MPAIRSDSLERALAELKRELDSPDLIINIGQELADQFQASFREVGLISRSGATLMALSFVGEPQRIGGGWQIGVGNRSDLGDESESAPRGTLRAFFTDYPELHPTPWRGIPESYQERLAELRRTGMYGGRGPTYANYMWVQNAGNAAAYITGRHFIESGIAAWREVVPDIIDEWLWSVRR